jgi:hypothetical protein
MTNKQDLTNADIDRSQAFLGAVLGAELAGNLPPDHQIGANFPPEPIVATEDQRIAALIEAANKWTEQHPVITTKDVAAACMDYLDQLDAQWAAFDDRRKAEREPHNAALKAIQDKWLPRLERIDICRRALRPIKQAWLRFDAARLKAEREAEEHKAAEAQRRADQLAEQAMAGGPNAVSQTIIALEATQEAERARQAAAAVPQRAQVRGNLGGRTHSLRTVWMANIVEQDLVYRHFRNHSEVKDLLQRLANAAARGGARNPNLPGCWIFSEEQ